MTRKPTIAQGAVIERALIQGWITRRLKNHPYPPGNLYEHALLDLRDWLDRQPKRTARKGGIGR